MASNRNALMQKFGRLRPSASLRRPDHLGHRRRVNLRLSADCVELLVVVRIASGEPTNSFAEQVISEAVKNRIEELRTHHDDIAWATIRQCAKALLERRR